MPKKIPMRQCVGCREMKEKRALIRVVKSPEGEISLDFRGKKPGRGAYLWPGPGVPCPGEKIQGAGEGLFYRPPRRGVRGPGGPDEGGGGPEWIIRSTLWASQKRPAGSRWGRSRGRRRRARQARLIVLARDAADNTCRRAAHFARGRRMSRGPVPLLQGGAGRGRGAHVLRHAGFYRRGAGRFLYGKALRPGRGAVRRDGRGGCPPRRPDCSSASGSSAATSRSCKRPGQSPGLLPASCGAERRLAQRGRGAPGKGGKTYPKPGKQS